MFVTFEGPEGAGKSTAIRAAAGALKALGRAVLVTREPGAGETGAAIRRILLDGGGLTREAETFLFLADRSQHVAEVIRPALQRREWVLCDRHADSTVVYQGHARGMDLDWLRSMNLVATGGLVPDLTLLFDLDPAVGLSRLTSKDRLDAEPLEFHEKVRQGFLEESRREPGRWRLVDAAQSKDEVLRQTLAHLGA